jgi:hypothetical protein
MVVSHARAVRAGQKYCGLLSPENEPRRLALHRSHGVASPCADVVRDEAVRFGWIGEHLVDGRAPRRRVGELSGRDERVDERPEVGGITERSARRRDDVAARLSDLHLTAPVVAEVRAFEQAGYERVERRLAALPFALKPDDVVVVLGEGGVGAAGPADQRHRRRQ